MNRISSLPVPALGRIVALHSLGWLTAANLVGVWMAVSLLWPGIGNLLSPLTFGRWAPLHLDWQLYGWCSLPLVGALLRWCLVSERPDAGAHARIALAVWSAALLLGGVSWLGGVVSGKLFLDWHGWARPLLPLAMVVFWIVLAGHTAGSWSHLAKSGRAARVALLALLLAVPPVLFAATARDVYPPINPDSGGATGAALLGSTLGVITIFLLVPRFVGVAAVRPVRGFVPLLVASWIVYAVVDRGHVSHHTVGARLALATLLLWIPLWPIFWGRHAWPEATRPWLRATAVWWALLVTSGWISFLPGASESLKFTHAFVGHAHLAMAGLVTSVNATVLIVLTRLGTGRAVFWLWQGGCAVYVASMYVLGVDEASRLAELFRSEGWTQGLFGVRLLAGLAMTAASLRWLLQTVRA